MQKSVIDALLSDSFDTQLHRAWQLMKHQAQSLGKRPHVRFISEELPASYRSEVTAVYQQSANSWLVRTSIPGLSGNRGTLQRSINKQLLTDLFSQGNSSALDFFNGFNNRYYRLYCATEIKHSLVDLMEEETFTWNSEHYQKSISDMLVSLCGVVADTPQLKKRDLIQYTGVIGMKLTCPKVLNRLLEDYFGYQFKTEHSGVEYQPLTSCSLTRLGVTGQNQVLGESALIGQRASMLSQKLHIKICPTSYQQYREIHGNDELAQAIAQMVQLYMGIKVIFTLHMRVNGSYLPKMRLSHSRNHGLCLGESAWMEGGNAFNQFVELPLKVKVS